METTVTVRVNPNLLIEAQREGVELAELLEHALLRRLATPTATRIKSERAEAWRRENEEALQAWNEFRGRNGVLSDGPGKL